MKTWPAKLTAWRLQRRSPRILPLKKLLPALPMQKLLPELRDVGPETPVRVPTTLKSIVSVWVLAWASNAVAT